MLVGIEQLGDDRSSAYSRVEQQARPGLGQVGPGPVPVLGWARAPPARAPRIVPPRLGAGDLLDAQVDAPGGGEVVLVGESFALA
jgi:hypothetical protein